MKHVSPERLEHLAERERIRAHIEARVQAWIDLLDRMDAPSTEVEPSLASLQRTDQTGWADGDGQDREVDHEGEDDSRLLLNVGQHRALLKKKAAAERRAAKAQARVARDKRLMAIDMLDTAPDLFALQCIGDCMLPLIASGAKVVVDKCEPCTSGDIVCVFLKVPGGMEAKIKRLVSLPPFALPYRMGGDVCPALVLTMLNPAQTLFVPLDEVVAVHKVVGLKLSDGSLDTSLIELNAAHLARTGGRP